MRRSDLFACLLGWACLVIMTVAGCGSSPPNPTPQQGSTIAFLRDYGIDLSEATSWLPFPPYAPLGLYRDIYTINQFDGGGTGTKVPLERRNFRSVAMCSDNKTAVLLTQVGQYPQVFVGKLDSQEPVQLTNVNLFYITSVALSPDCSTIVFGGRSGVVGPDYLMNIFYTMKPDGTNLKRIQLDKSLVLDQQRPSFSPDGTKITFYGIIPFVQSEAVFVANLDGTGVTNVLANVALTPGSSSPDGPVFSPGGKKIYFWDRNSYDIYAVASDGSSTTIEQLTTTGNNLSPVPIGNIVLFLTYRDGNVQIYVMNPDGSDQKPLLQQNSGHNDFFNDAMY